MQASCVARHLDWILVLADSARETPLGRNEPGRVAEARVKLLRIRSGNERPRADLSAASVADALDLLAAAHAAPAPSASPAGGSARPSGRRVADKPAAAAGDAGASEARVSKDWEREEWGADGGAGGRASSYDTRGSGGGGSVGLYYTERKLKQTQAKALALAAQKKVSDRRLLSDL